MRTGDLPATVDPVKLADAKARLAGELPLRAMQRLRAMCVDDESAASVVLQFECSGESGVRRVYGDIAITVHVACQRCLQPMPLVLDAHPSLIIVAPDARADALGQQADVLVADRPIALASIVEDELLLAMPMIPTHDASECPVAAFLGKAEQQKHDDNPFSVLGRLKHKD